MPIVLRPGGAAGSWQPGLLHGMAWQQANAVSNKALNLSKQETRTLVK